MEGQTLESIGLTEELVNRACSVATAAHKLPAGRPYLVESSGLSTVLIGFPGSWTVDDWFGGSRAFGESTINLQLFPSLKSIGKAEAAVINAAFLRRFESLLADSSFIAEVERAADKKQIVFTGHSIGAPVAIFATLWFLESHRNQPNQQLLLPPQCITFGSPLVGDQILHHATRRENWARHFKHFVTRYDIIPRVSFSPLSSIDEQSGYFRPVLHYFNPNSALYASEYISRKPEASSFFVAVMRNAASVASHAACKFMGSTNPLLETVAQFVKLSPYRPFGTYVFCAGNGKLTVVENPDAVLQLLFYSLQWASEAEAMEAAHRSLKDHLGYGAELQESLGMQAVAYLDRLEDVPLSGVGSTDIGTALGDLGINTRARLCLRAAGELVNQKMRNQMKIDNNKRKIEVALNTLQCYQERCEVRKVGYYDAFKIQKDQEDFNSNVKRLELAGMWDEIIEMLKRYELPDEFEGRKEWIELGTKYRRIAEPLDIANYYRHSLNESTGPYMLKGRPNRYKFVQRWREHAMKMESQSIPESCVWAEIEELHIITSHNKMPFENVKERVLQLEKDVSQWVRTGQLGGDIFLHESTFVKWWKTLPHQHTAVSSIADLLCE